MENKFKVGDKVKVISTPMVEDNPRGQAIINDTMGYEGRIDHVFKHGVRNIQVSFFGHGLNYYSAENLTKATP